MKVLYVASEGLPYIKSGGLADVIGSLPEAVQTPKLQVATIMPLYSKIIEKRMPELTYEMTVHVNQGMYDTDVRIFSHTIKKIKTYFIENQAYFERPELYGYPDDGERFAFFQHAVMNFIVAAGGEYDIVHCHDWHTGMIPVLGRTMYKWHNEVSKLKYVYTIHNLAFQGNFPTGVLTECFGLTMDLMYDNSVNFYDGMSFMKGGIFYSDKITTVSETYAHEILTPEFGENMEYVLSLRADDLSGIVNGIDTKMWDPKKDNLIYQPYDAKSLEAKAENKTRLQEEYGLHVNPDVPLFSMVSRLTGQKGVQLLIERFHEMMSRDMQVFILGSGDPMYESALYDVVQHYPGRAVFYRGYNEALSHEIYAASDFFLMPSYFEPCGISQLISLRYGTLPIVRETGGLKDTVAPYNQYTLEGTGFTFTHFNGYDFADAVGRAHDVYWNKEAFNQLRLNAMEAKVGWLESARAYRDLYRGL